MISIAIYLIKKNPVFPKIKINSSFFFYLTWPPLWNKLTFLDKCDIWLITQCCLLITRSCLLFTSNSRSSWSFPLPLVSSFSKPSHQTTWWLLWSTRHAVNTNSLKPRYFFSDLPWANKRASKTYIYAIINYENESL